ncbi:hypothetical protein A2779_00815 [Candidatus Roizmanbacteria bacterium RIFCSPHIGHO2_01_FULL_40_98]|nr:MAG: hypothetical protein A2779_00815 [Candidatus Roizmanbacteria bacterium RIFCSPHIGHO2_01_FULL_40_98]
MSDPGFLLVKEVVKRNIPYDSIPGSSSVTNALVLSGLQAKKWMFVGFFPKKRNDLVKLLNSLKEITKIDKEIIFVGFESSQRINESLKIFTETSSNAEIVIAREMTKKFQEVLRGKPEELSEKTYKGELTAIFKIS